MGARNCTTGRFAQDDASPSMSQRRDRCSISEAKEGDLEEAECSIRDPHRCSKERDDDRMLGKIGTMESNHDQDKHEHKNMYDIEEFVSELAKKECCGEDNEHGKTSNNSNDLGGLQKVFQFVAFSPCVYIYHGVKNAPEDCTIARHLMKDVDAFVGVGCEERKRCVLQRKEGRECEVGYGNPG